MALADREAAGLPQKTSAKKTSVLMAARQTFIGQLPRSSAFAAAEFDRWKQEATGAPDW
jgi:hypothetical protein